MALFFCPSVVVVAAWVVPSTHSGPSQPQVLSPSPCSSGGIVLCHWFFAWLFIPKPVNMIRLGFFTTPPLTSSVHSFLLYVFGECRSIGGRSLLALSSGWRKHYGKLCKSLLVISRASLMLPVLATIWPVWVDGLIYSESKARGCLFSLASPKESWFLIDWISNWCRWISHHCLHGLEAILLRFSSSPDNSSSQIRGARASVLFQRPGGLPFFSCCRMFR